jgi:hypothetical protein
MVEAPKSTIIGFSIPEGADSTIAHQRIHPKVHREDPEVVYGNAPPNLLLRRQLDNFYRKELAPLPQDYLYAIEQAIEEKAAFLDALQAILKSGHPTINVRQQFKDLALYGNDGDQKLYTSQPLLVMRDSHVTKKNKDIPMYRVANESTTRFIAGYGVLNCKIGKASLSAPMYESDVDARNILLKFGVSEKILHAYDEEFLSLASFVDHDWLHQLVDPARTQAHYEFPSHDYNINDKLPVSEFRNENILLALQIKVANHLFSLDPALKQRVLQGIAQQFYRIADMQNTALNHATTEEERKDITEAITYYTERYAHRVFRGFAVDDAALQETLKIPLSPQVQLKTSIAQACNKIRLTTPWQLADSPHGDGLMSIYNHCAVTLKDTYDIAHTMRETKLYFLKKPACEMQDPDECAKAEHHMVPIEEIVPLFGETIPALKNSYEETQKLMAHHHDKSGRTGQVNHF